MLSLSYFIVIIFPFFLIIILFSLSYFSSLFLCCSFYFLFFWLLFFLVLLFSFVFLSLFLTSYLFFFFLLFWSLSQGCGVSQCDERWFELRVEFFDLKIFSRKIFRPSFHKICFGERYLTELHIVVTFTKTSYNKWAKFSIADHSLLTVNQKDRSAVFLIDKCFSVSY